APAPLIVAGSLDMLEASAQPGEAFTQPATVDFELGLTGSARPDPAAARAYPSSAAACRTTAHPRQMRPLPRQARLQVRKLRNLHLQLACQGAGALRKNVQDELAAIDNPQLQLIFQGARLRRRQCVVEDRDGRIGHPRNLANLAGLPSADKRAGIGSLE